MRYARVTKSMNALAGRTEILWKNVVSKMMRQWRRNGPKRSSGSRTSMIPPGRTPDETRLAKIGERIRRKLAHRFAQEKLPENYEFFEELHNLDRVIEK